VAEPLLVLLVGLAVLVARPGARRPAAAGRRPPRTALREGTGGGAGVDGVTVLELLAVAVEAGASVPHALASVGAALGGASGADLARAGSALLLGASWPAAWTHAPDLGRQLDGLAASWTTGAACGPILRASAAALRQRRERAAQEAAGRLGVRIVLPLGLCFLPAFVLAGLVPVLLSLAGSLFG
jgi:pilus assembly protein TadC